MTWTLSASGTKTVVPPTACTFTTGSALILATQLSTPGDMVTFSTTGGNLPTGFTAFTNYFVISTSLTSTGFEVSTTTSTANQVTTGSSPGVGTTTGVWEHRVAIDTNNATFVPQVETTNLALGDMAELRAYTICLNGGTITQSWKGCFQHAQINNEKISPPIASDQQLMLTIRQTAGATGRAYPWKLLRI